MKLKGTNAVTIYDASDPICDPRKELWSGDMNTAQLHKILNWVIDWEFDLCFSPCGGESENINLTEVKIKCLQGSLEFYKMGNTFMIEKGAEMTMKELLKLKKQWTKEEADQKENTKQ